MEQTTAPQNETSEQADIRLNKDVAAFSYVWIMAPVIYFSRKDSAFIQYHSKQGIVLFLLSIPVSFLPYIGRYLMFIVVGGMLLGFLNAANGQTRDVPFAGPLSRGEMSLSDFIHLVMNGGRKINATLKNLYREHGPKKQQPKASDDASAPADTTLDTK